MGDQFDIFRNSRVLVLVDGNSFYMRNWSVFKNIMNKGGVYGYLKNFNILLGKLNARWKDSFHFWDGANGKERRKKIYNEYKSNRVKYEKESADDLYQGIRDLQNFVLPYLGAVTFYNDNYEADDLIAAFLRRFLKNSNYDYYVIVSDDSDLWQLFDLSSRVKIYNRNGWVDLKKMGYNSGREWMMVKVLAGDKVDNIPPVEKGIGVKTALKILRDGKIKSEWRARMRMNEQLVNLLDAKYESPMDASFKMVVKSRDDSKLLEYFMKHGLRLEMLFKE